jgi:transposase
MTKHYPQEFRDYVVRVARLRQSSIRQIARDFGISAGTLYQWLAKVEGENAGTPSADQVVENRELRRRNRVLEQEVEILRRATAYFAKNHSPK